MKYILINLKSFIRNETAIFLLVLLCIFSSVVIINFSFGFYHHLEQKKLDSEVNSKEMSIDFHDPTRDTVTKGSLLELLYQLDSDVLDNCIITFEGRFAEDKTEDAAIDNSHLVEDMPFCMEDGTITVAPLEERWKENAILVDGSYFTAEQVENGEMVCIADTEKEWAREEEAAWAAKYSANPDGTYTVNGKEYACIGHADLFTCVPMVPVTTVADDCYVQRVIFEYSKVMTRNAYTKITGCIREAYGDLADIPELDIQEVDSLKFYNTLLVLCVLLIVMSGIVLSMLYEYVLLQRRRQLTVYRLCGLTRGKAKRLYFMECLCISVIIYMLAVLFFHLVMLPYLGSMFEYIEASCTPYSYTLLGVMYIGISSVILYVMICRQMGGNVVNELKEG